MKFANLPCLALFGHATVQAEGAGTGDGTYECRLNPDGSKPPCWDPISAIIQKIQREGTMQRSVRVQEVVKPRLRTGFQPTEYKLSESKVADYLNIDTEGQASYDYYEKQNKAQDQDQVEDSHARKRRGFGLQFSINMAANYGCWCYGGSQWPTTHGISQARDEHDEACKAHSMAFRCIRSDAKAQNKVCEPEEVAYEMTVGQPAYNTLQLRCSDSIAEDWCKRRVCMVELRLVARFWHLLMSGTPPDYSKWGHTSINGPFDPIQECQPTGVGEDPIHEVCCGDYPYRVWFHQAYSDEETAEESDYQCCTYQLDEVNQSYGFEINIGKVYNQYEETCSASGVETGSTIIRPGSIENKSGLAN